MEPMIIKMVIKMVIKMAKICPYDSWVYDATRERCCRYDQSDKGNGKICT